MCLKSTLSDLEPQILCVLSNNVEATDLSLLGFFYGFLSEFICSSLGIILLQCFST